VDQIQSQNGTLALWGKNFVTDFKSEHWCKQRFLSKKGALPVVLIISFHLSNISFKGRNIS
jgi:hypothetical protein